MLGGGNYILTSFAQDAPNENQFVRYFSVKSQGESYRSLKGLFKKFYKTLAGMGFLPERFVKEFNPNYYFPGIRFDYIILRFQRAACLFPYHKIAPIILDYDDHPLQCYDTVIKYLIPPVIRPFSWIFNRLQFQIVKRRIFGGFLSNGEQVGGFGHNVSFMPNVVPYPNVSYNAKNTERKYLFTIGQMGYSPNSEGVDKFLNEVWREYHAKYPDIRYIIGGKGAPEEYSKRWNLYEGVDYIGFVDDLDKMYENCIASIIPVWSGSGTAIKTRESMIHSRCCLSTPFGSRGLCGFHEVKDKGLFTFRSADDFIEAFEKVSDVRLRTECEDNVFLYARKNCTSESMEVKLKEKLDALGCSNM